MWKSHGLRKPRPAVLVHNNGATISSPLLLLLSATPPPPPLLLASVADVAVLFAAEEGEPPLAPAGLRPAPPPSALLES